MSKIIIIYLFFLINKNRFLKEEVKVIQEQCNYSMRKMLPLEVLLWERGERALSTDSREVEDGVERRDRWYTVTKKWSSRVQQEHRNKSQDCVTVRLDYDSDNRLEDLESELRNRAWCCATFWRLPRGNSLCLGPGWRRHCFKRSNNEVSEHCCNKVMKLKQ